VCLGVGWSPGVACACVVSVSMLCDVSVCGVVVVIRVSGRGVVW
jgi:hypothetical protein